MTLEQAADALCVCRRTVQTLVAAGKIPSIRITARCRRIDARDLAEFIETRKQAAS
jgi:excisionase family DNA binding protein